MTKNPLGVAIVGCGVIGRAHAEVIAEIAGLRVVALIDERQQATSVLAEGVANATGSAPGEYRSLDNALSTDESIDVVVIATPSGLHVDLAITALAAGKHVVIEKPIDVDLARAAHLVAAARAARSHGQLCTVISQHRFDGENVELAEAIAAGRLGRVTSAIATVPWWRSQEYYDSGAWRGTWALDGGGALMNQGVHTVDLLLWFLGTPITVSAEIGRLAHTGIEVEDTAVAAVTFESGALGLIHATTAGFPGLPVRIQVQGDQGSAVIDGENLAIVPEADDAMDPGVPSGEGIDDSLSTEWVGHVRQYRDLVRAIDGEIEPHVTVEDAFLALATVRAVYVSAAIGRRIQIADVIAGEFDHVEIKVPSATSRA